MYKILIKPVFKLMSPRRAKRVALGSLEFICRIPVLRSLVTTRYTHPTLQRSFFGLDFRNPVGVAPGIDTDGVYFDELSRLGASFVEIGPITLAPELGNRNVREIIDNIRANTSRNQGVIAADIKCTEDVAPSKAASEIDRLYTLLYDFIDIAVIDLDGIDDIYYQEIIDRVTTIRRFNDDHRPILFRFPATMTYPQMDKAIHLILSYGLDGLVVSNRGTEGNLDALRYILNQSSNLLPVIISGGMNTVDDAVKTLQEGAAMVEVSAFIQNGPHFVKRILKTLAPKKSK